MALVRRNAVIGRAHVPAAMAPPAMAPPAVAHPAVVHQAIAHQTVAHQPVPHQAVAHQAVAHQAAPHPAVAHPAAHPVPSSPPLLQGATPASPGSAAAPVPAEAAAMPVSLPGHEMAAAVATLPARPWAVLTGLGLTLFGAFGAWNIAQFGAVSPFRIGDEMSIFAALLVFSTAVERVLEPFSRWMPGRSEQQRYEKAVADMDNGVPGATNAAAHYKAATDQARASRGILMWGLATCIATLLSAGSGFYLLRMLSTTPGWTGVSTWVDALVTGLVVGSGTKPLHDLISRMQRQSSAPQTPV